MLATVSKRAHRGLTYLHNGQRFYGWIPAGQYRILGDCIVRERDGADIDCVKIERDITEKLNGEAITRTETWYAGRVSFACR